MRLFAVIHIKMSAWFDYSLTLALTTSGQKARFWFLKFDELHFPVVKENSFEYSKR